MPITAYTGLPRSGKSFSVVERVIIPAAKSGRKVYSNIPLDKEKLDKDFPENQVHQYDMKDVANDPSWFASEELNGSIIVMDELWRLWQSGTKVNQIPESQLALIKEHGHRTGHNGKTIELVFVTQDAADLATAARNMVEWTYRTTKLDGVGQPDRYRVDIYHGVKTGPEAEPNKRTDQLFGKYKPEIYKYYQSQTQSVGDEHGDESKSDTRFALGFKKKLAMIAACLLAVPFVLWFLASTLYGYYSTGGKPDEANQENQVQVANQGSSPAAQSRPAEPAAPDLPGIEIVYNSGHWPSIDYKFRLSSGNQVAIVDRHQLLQIGYRTKAITNCLVQVTNERGRSVLAMCPKNGTGNQSSILHTAAAKI